MDWTEAMTDDFREAVEFRVGMGAGAWDTVDPREICAAVIEEALARGLVTPSLPR